MDALLTMVDDDFGSAAGWLRAQGWTDDEIDALRRKLTVE